MSTVLSEHFDYLSLEGRSQIYDEAISKVIGPDSIVADLGAGFGVLGIQCLKAGAAHVYGVDSTDAIAIAREAVERIGRGDDYTCIRGSTYRTNLPQKVDLAICDHIGWFGFDYGMIPMIEDARARMLKTGGQVMPRRLRLMAAAVESQKSCAVIEDWAKEPIPEEYHWLRENMLNAKIPCKYMPEELCSKPVMLGEIDLTQDNPDSFSFKAALPVNRDGQCNGIAGWFEVELAEDVWMTNSPLEEKAIKRNQVYLAARDAFPVKTGDQIEIGLRFRKDGDMIAWSIRPDGQPRQKLSTWSSLPISQAELVAQNSGTLELNAIGRARQAVLALVDGARTASQIEQILLETRPQLLPSAEELSKFVRDELGRVCS